jgi:hypothetical protein
MTETEWADSRDTLADLFFDKWTHKRIDAELEASAQAYERRAAAGRKGGKAKAKPEQNDIDASGSLEKCSSNASAMLKQSQSHITSLRSVIAPAAAPETKREKSKAHRLPDDWQPDRDAAVKAGLPAGRIDRTAEKFRDYWLAQGGEKGRKVDWLATWRNWCRNEADRLPASERASVPAAPVGDPQHIRLSMDTPDADRARYFIATGHWSKWWGYPPGDEDCSLPKALIRQCLEARRIAA